MNPYLEPHGFLGTGASLLADITFLAYLIIIIPTMIVGFGFARRKLFRPYHKITMTAITVVNWVLIIFLMLFAYRYDVADNIGSQTSNSRYLLPTIHGIIGLVAQLLATYVLFRMYREDGQVARAKARGEKDTSKYWFKSAKPIMRLTLTLWLITSVMGVFNYLIRYDIIPTYQLSLNVIAPAATSEAFAAPLRTPEVGAPVATGEVTAQAPVSTEAATVQPPAKTPEAPAETVQPPVVTVEVYIVVTATQSPSLHAPASTPEIQAPIETEALIAPSSTQSPTRTVSATAATAEVLAPISTPEVLSPLATSEVKPPAQTPEVPNSTPEIEPPVATEELSSPTLRPPASTPEIKPPVATEEVSNSPTATQPPTQAIRLLVATLEVHAPVTTPEVLSPVVTEEVTTATTTPTSTLTCAITPTVRPPVATEDLSEFTNTPTATNTPDCSTSPTVRPPVTTPEVSATATPFGYIDAAPAGD